MSRSRSLAAVTVALLTVAVAGCGVGPGGSEDGTASLRVTRDHGAELIDEATIEDPTESETVVRFLDRETDIETSYGGNFVDSIDGISSAVEGGRSFDWYYYVNGYWSPVGAGEATVHAGDRIWWDYRDWTDSYRVPAVVGSYPEPFKSGFNGEKIPTELVCFPSGESSGACDEVETSLSGADADRRCHDAGRLRPTARTHCACSSATGTRSAPTAPPACSKADRGRAACSPSRSSAATAGRWRRSPPTRPCRGSAPTRAGSRPCSSARTSRPGSSPRPARTRSARPRRCSTRQTLRDHYAVADFGDGPLALPTPEPVPGLSEASC